MLFHIFKDNLSIIIYLMLSMQVLAPPEDFTFLGSTLAAGIPLNGSSSIVIPIFANLSVSMLSSCKLLKVKRAS